MANLGTAIIFSCVRFQIYGPPTEENTGPSNVGHKERAQGRYPPMSCDTSDSGPNGFSDLGPVAPVNQVKQLQKFRPSSYNDPDLMVLVNQAKRH